MSYQLIGIINNRSVDLVAVLLWPELPGHPFPEAAGHPLAGIAPEPVALTMLHIHDQADRQARHQKASDAGAGAAAIAGPHAALGSAQIDRRLFR
jgi:hypothetical protein